MENKKFYMLTIGQEVEYEHIRDMSECKKGFYLESLQECFNECEYEEELLDMASSYILDLCNEVSNLINQLETKDRVINNLEGFAEARINDLKNK
ncbi:hypothetical protein [Clostridium sp.]|uniref:hypothetical protein n=1 Tax=Clostridium sp. TaxID=1506 RepID=UPI0032173265